MWVLPAYELGALSLTLNPPKCWKRLSGSARPSVPERERVNQLDMRTL
jgi:hypothetical protein